MRTAAAETMVRSAREQAPLRIRALSPGDLAAVRRIDAHHTGASKPAYWRRIFREFLKRSERRNRVGLAAVANGRVVGYLFGEVRAFEFGSGPCGWVFAVGVDPAALRTGVASALLVESWRRFRAAGVTCVRTMVRRTDVPVLSFFRSNGFAGGPYVQLELGPRPIAAPEG